MKIDGSAQLINFHSSLVGIFKCSDPACTIGLHDNPVVLLNSDRPEKDRYLLAFQNRETAVNFAKQILFEIGAQEAKEQTN
jgi:hypothetical protein